MTNTRPPTLEDLLTNNTEHEVFRRIKAGELIPIDRHTETLISCPFEHHELKRLSEIVAALIPGTAPWQTAKAKADEYQAEHYGTLQDMKHLLPPRNREESEHLKTCFADAVFIAPLSRNPQEAAIFKALSGTAGITFMGVPNLQFQGRFDSGEWKSEWSTLGPEERAKLRDRLGMELSAWLAQLQDLLNREAAVHLENLNASEGSMAGVRALWTSEPIAQKQIEAEQRIALLERQIRFLTPSVALPDATPGRLKDGGQMQFPEWVSAEKLIKDGTFTEEQVVDFVLTGQLTPWQYDWLEERNGMLRVNDGSCPWEPGWVKIDGSATEQNRSRVKGYDTEIATLRAHRVFPQEEHSMKFRELQGLKHRLEHSVEQAGKIDVTQEAKLHAESNIRDLPKLISALERDLEPQRVWEHNRANVTYYRHIKGLLFGEETFYPIEEAKACLFQVGFGPDSLHELEFNIKSLELKPTKGFTEEKDKIETLANLKATQKELEHRARFGNAPRQPRKELEEQAAIQPRIVSEPQEQRPAEIQPPDRKTDYRREQWKNAKPIMEDLCKGNEKTITLEKIRSDPRFKACFKDGIPPGESQTRRELRKAGIKLAPGKRKEDTP